MSGYWVVRSWQSPQRGESFKTWSHRKRDLSGLTAEETQRNVDAHVSDTTCHIGCTACSVWRLRTGSLGYHSMRENTPTRTSCHMLIRLKKVTYLWCNHHFGSKVFSARLHHVLRLHVCLGCDLSFGSTVEGQFFDALLLQCRVLFNLSTSPRAFTTFGHQLCESICSCFQL